MAFAGIDFSPFDNYVSDQAGKFRLRFCESPESILRL